MQSNDPRLTDSREIIYDGKRLGCIEQTEDGMFVIRTVKRRQAGNLAFATIEEAQKCVDGLMRFLATAENDRQFATEAK